MDLRSSFNFLLESYPKAVEETFSGHHVANFVRKELPGTLQNMLSGNPRYITNGSPGQGNWAKSPWVAIYDRFVTESAQEGYYIVYLVREDYKGIYLSLNQGITTVKKLYGAEARTTLRVRSADFRARLGSLTEGLHCGEIDLASHTPSSLSRFYEAGNICSLFYATEDLPEEEKLASDLYRFLNLYLKLASSEPQLFAHAAVEEDENFLADEDLRVLREHKRIERNKKLAQKAKQHHGYKCKACGFDFEAKYGPIGKDFIEAHHLIPLCELKGKKLTLSPKHDFTVLCSNCHRMIHKTAFVYSVEEFRAHYVVQP